MPTTLSKPIGMRPESTTPHGCKSTLEGADDQFPRIEHLWVDQGYTRSGRHWIEAQLGWSVEVVRHPPHPQGEWVPHGNLKDWRTVWFSWEPRQRRRCSVACCQGAAWWSGHSRGS